MASNQLYQAALSFRKTNLWKKLHDNQLFAVSLSNHQIGYCCVMGARGEHLALALYPGEAALQSYYLLYNLPVPECPSIFHHQEIIFQQNCLQCSFETMRELTKEEAAALRAYTKQHQIALRGKNACPQFTKYSPSCPFGPISDPAEESLLEQALLAGLAVDQRVEEEGTAWLEPLDLEIEGQTIPLLTPTEHGFQWSAHTLPPIRSSEDPTPLLKDELLLERLKRTKKSRNRWIFDVVMVPTAVAEATPTGALSAHFPYLLLGICSNTQELMILPDTLDHYDLEQSEHLLASLGHWMLERKVPSQMTACNHRTYALLLHLAQQLGIKLNQNTSPYSKDTALLVQAENDLAEQIHAPDEDIDDLKDELLEFLVSADDDELRSVPDFVWHDLTALAKQGFLPPDLAQRILQLRR